MADKDKLKWVNFEEWKPSVSGSKLIKTVSKSIPLFGIGDDIKGTKDCIDLLMNNTYKNESNSVERK